MQVRCRSHMTSALRAEGIGLKADDTTDRLHEWDSDKGEGSKNPKFLRTLYVNGPLKEERPENGTFLPKQKTTEQAAKASEKRDGRG